VYKLLFKSISITKYKVLSDIVL